VRKFSGLIGKFRGNEQDTIYGLERIDVIEPQDDTRVASLRDVPVPVTPASTVSFSGVQFGVGDADAAGGVRHRRYQAP
jgi:predicted metal-dependent enzyme (double-stranded beta helix superfamily)